MTLPNFLIIGAAKCATTSLASLLDAHPEAAIVNGKEPHFFSYDENYARGMEYYKKKFITCTNEKAVGDASTSYSRIRQHPQVVARIRKHLGLPKIIYMVRHPIDRIESAYIEQMTEPQNIHIKSINQALSERPMMLDSSRYWETYSAYRKYFPADKIKLIWFEEYIQNIEKSYQDVCRFLNIDPTYSPDLSRQQANSRAVPRSRLSSDVVINSKWKKSTLKFVKLELKNDNRKFLAYFNKPPTHWDF